MSELKADLYLDNNEHSCQVIHTTAYIFWTEKTVSKWRERSRPC